MRLPISSVIASIAVALTTPSSPALGQQSGGGSTIRLAAAGESTREGASYDSGPQLQGQRQDPASEQGRIAPPIQHRAQLTEQPVRAMAPPIVHTAVESPKINRTRMPAGFYASPEARATLNQLPGPAPVQSASRVQTTRRGGKPFQAIQSQPTISPYLYLNAGTNSASPMTNYFAFVRPQIEAQETGRAQQREIQQLRNQLQKISSTGGVQAGSQNTAAHYMDTAQFYRGLQR